MNPNQEQSCFLSYDLLDISLSDGSKSSRAEVQKDSLPLIRLVGNNQTKPQLCSSQLLIGHSSTCLTHSVDDYCPPISQFQKSSYQLTAHSFDGDSWDLNHMPQTRLQYNDDFGTNFSVSKLPYSNDVHPQQIDNLSYPAQSLESISLSPKQEENLPPLPLAKVSVPPCCYFQSSSSQKDSFSHSLQVPYRNYELFPESENIFQTIWKLATNTVDQNSNCRKRLPCFINITNKAEVHSPTVSSQAGSAMCLSDSDVNQLNKMPIKIFSDPKNSFQIGKSVTSTVDQSSNCTDRLPCSFKVTNEVQVDSPMFSEAGSPEHWTASNVNLANNIEQMIDFMTKTTQAGSPLTDPPMMTGQAGSPVHVIYPPLMTSQTGSPIHFISPDVNQQATNLQQELRFKSFLLYKTELCRNFRKGHCRKGDKCQFAHGYNDLRDIEKHPLFKKIPCKNFFKFGYCRFADKCMFSHLPNPTSSQPHNIGSDGEASPRSSYSSSPPNRKSFDLGAFTVKKGR